MYNGFIKKDNVSKKSAYIRGGIVGVLSCLVMMIVFSAVLLCFNIDRAYAAPFATISVAVGSYAASRITAKKIGDKGYIVGLIIGSVIFVIITIISLFMATKVLKSPLSFLTTLQERHIRLRTQCHSQMM